MNQASTSLWENLSRRRQNKSSPGECCSGKRTPLGFGSSNTRTPPPPSMPPLTSPRCIGDLSEYELQYVDSRRILDTNDVTKIRVLVMTSSGQALGSHGKTAPGQRMTLAGIFQMKYLFGLSAKVSAFLYNIRSYTKPEIDDSVNPARCHFVRAFISEYHTVRYISTAPPTLPAKSLQLCYGVGTFTKYGLDTQGPSPRGVFEHGQESKGTYGNVEMLKPGVNFSQPT
ncbi:hypothetical protein BKA82DRAFT_4106479 [Pisolithus tinctorius]|nr:hypothetical protein BKA82DRAFT_4106479 [Pisolithus tinctorius]